MWVAGLEEGQLSVNFGCRFGETEIPNRLHFWSAFQLEYQAELSILSDTVTFRDRSQKRLGRQLDLVSAYRMRTQPGFRAGQEAKCLLLSNKEFEGLAKANSAAREMRVVAEALPPPSEPRAQRERRKASQMASIAEVPLPQIEAGEPVVVTGPQVVRPVEGLAAHQSDPVFVQGSSSGNSAVVLEGEIPSVRTPTLRSSTGASAPVRYKPHTSSVPPRSSATG
jgi:hypothetical protein